MWVSHVRVRRGGFVVARSLFPRAGGDRDVEVEGKRRKGGFELDRSCVGNSIFFARSRRLDQIRKRGEQVWFLIVEVALWVVGSCFDAQHIPSTCLELDPIVGYGGRADVSIIMMVMEMSTSNETPVRSIRTPRRGEVKCGRMSHEVD